MDAKKRISRSTWLGIAIVLAVLIAAAGIYTYTRQSVSAAAAAAEQQAYTETAAQDNQVPILAYYYIWFDKKSWDRAKTDYPILGPYSSDDRYVMRKHIRTAKAAGIDGFIVSWKSTDKLNRRLAQLVELAGEENFKLAIIFQGLDFYRDPQPVERISSDLDYFTATYGSNPVFNIYGKPMVIWSGTWEFTREEIQAVTDAHRDSLLILSSEKNPNEYLAKADLFDGNAYYWSSVNPDTYPGYQAKLDDFSAAVHGQGGIWIAPAAPGFDARLVGGTSIVERNNGTTLLKELTAARNSTPDAVGLISWNEFSENSHIEPSINFENTYLDVLKSDQNISLADNGVDSSAPSGLDLTFNPARIGALAGLLGLVAFSVVAIVSRASHKTTEMQR